MDNRNDYVLQGGEVFVERDDQTGRYRVCKVLAASAPHVAIIRSYKETFATPQETVDTTRLTPDTCGPVRYAAIFASWLAAEDDWIEEVSEGEERSVDIIVRGSAGS